MDVMQRRSDWVPEKAKSGYPHETCVVSLLPLRVCCSWVLASQLIVARSRAGQGHLDFDSKSNLALVVGRWIVRPRSLIPLPRFIRVEELRDVKTPLEKSIGEVYWRRC